MPPELSELTPASDAWQQNCGSQVSRYQACSEISGNPGTLWRIGSYDYKDDFIPVFGAEVIFFLDPKLPSRCGWDILGHMAISVVFCQVEKGHASQTTILRTGENPGFFTISDVLGQLGGGLQYCCWWFTSPANQLRLVVSFSHDLRFFFPIPGGCLGFLGASTVARIMRAEGSSFSQWNFSFQLQLKLQWFPNLTRLRARIDHWIVHNVNFCEFLSDPQQVGKILGDEPAGGNTGDDSAGP